MARSLAIYVFVVDIKNPTQGITGSLSLSPPASFRRCTGYPASASLFPTSIWSYTILNNTELRGSSTERIPFGTYVRPNFLLVFAEFIFCWRFYADNHRLNPGYGDFASS
jgi:hypothetical protein